MLCGFSIVGVGRGEMDKGQNAQAGPPTSWVPPDVYPSQNPASSEIKQPTSLWKRREGCSVARVAERGVAVIFGPTSLKRGEGPLDGGFKLRSHPKIAVDIGVRLFDKKIKS